MADNREFILGEFRRSLDDRYRVSLPGELANPLTRDGAECILAKERRGALSIWNSAAWGTRLDQSVDLVRTKIEAGRLEGRIEDVQNLGRLLSTRHKQIQIAGRGRLLIPEGFREFLGVEPGEEVLLVGAALCVEVWKPDQWFHYLEGRMPEFGQLLDDLAG